MIENYFQKTYAGWLGKIIGIRLGSPIEGWSYKEIKEKYGEITDYLVDYHDYAADDDSNGPLFFARSLMDFDPENITESEMAHTWLNYVPEHHGFFWWGGYGISTEHTAYDNLKNGIDAPMSGSEIQNGAACSEQIGGQIFSDSWGFVCPDNPEKAAALAAKMARVSHDGEAVFGGMFVAACVSAAYNSASVREVMEKGLSQIPVDSLYARLCREVMSFYDNDREKNWRDCMSFLLDNYGYDKYPGNCHIIPNAGVVFLSLLYGDGDFTRTQLICNMCGWDTDCNAGNVGSIVGVLAGIDGIEDKWIIPVNDLLISSSVLGGLNIDTVSLSAQLFCKIGYRLSREAIPSFWKPRLETKDRLIHFDFEKSTGSIRTSCSDEKIKCRLHNSGERLWEGHRSLYLHAGEIGKDSSVTAYVKTYYKPEDLHDSRYDPAFTPVVFPGQTMTCRLCSTSSFPVEAEIRILDSNSGRVLCSEPVILHKDWTVLEYKIPSLKGALIKEAGIRFQPAESFPDSGDLQVFINEIRWSGTPDYTIDFSLESVEFFGYAGGTLHREISQMTYLNGLWELDGKWLSGSCHKEGECYTGHYYAEDYEFSATILPLKGLCHLLNFRVQGGARSYAFGFFGDGKAALLKKDQTYSVLKSCDFPVDIGCQYRIKVIAEDSRFTLYIDEVEIFCFEDDSSMAYRFGQVGFTVLNGSHCHFSDMTFKPVSW